MSSVLKSQQRANHKISDPSRNVQDLRESGLLPAHGFAQTVYENWRGEAVSQLITYIFLMAKPDRYFKKSNLQPNIPC